MSHLKDAHKTPQFWLIWAVLCLNVSAGIGIIGAASPMLQETFGGTLFRDPSAGFTQFTDAQKTLAAAIGGGFVGLFSLFNIGGRFFWATLSDSIGRKTTYFVFFVLGVVCYAIAPTLAGMKAVVVFAAAFCIIACDVRRRICYRAGLSRGYVRHAIRRRDPWPFAHRVVDGGDRRSGDRQLPA